MRAKKKSKKLFSQFQRRERLKGQRKKGEFTKKERMTRERDVRIKGRGRGNKSAENWS